MAVDKTTQVGPLVLHPDTEMAPSQDLDRSKEEVDPASQSASENGSQDTPDEKWEFSTRALLVFVTLSTLTLMVALDGTSISVALPVGSSKLVCECS
jgi:hypothetical protein